jgi:hypothetical protein
MDLCGDYRKKERERKYKKIKNIETTHPYMNVIERNAL